MTRVGRWHVVKRLPTSDRLRANAWMGVQLAVIAAVALALRASLVHATNDDAELQETWLQFIRSHGGLESFKYEFSNYTPLYSYLLWLGAHLQFGASDLVVVKWGAMAADFVCAAFVYRIVRLRHPLGPAPTIAFAVILFTPTVAINSAYWGQIDMLWTAPLVAAVYYLLAGRSLAAMVAFSIGLAAKQQAEFLAPLLVVLALKGRVAWRHFLAVPIVYFVLLLPDVGGGSLALEPDHDLLGPGEEVPRADVQRAVGLGWVPSDLAVELSRPAQIWGLSLILLLMLVAVGYRFEPTPRLLVGLATISVVFVPFVLPRMHERYFFAADVLSIVLVFYSFRLFPVALLIQAASFFSYWPFLWRAELASGKLLVSPSSSRRGAAELDRARDPQAARLTGSRATGSGGEPVEAAALDGHHVELTVRTLAEARQALQRDRLPSDARRLPVRDPKLQMMPEQ